MHSRYRCGGLSVCTAVNYRLSLLRGGGGETRIFIERRTSRVRMRSVEMHFKERTTMPILSRSFTVYILYAKITGAEIIVASRRKLLSHLSEILISRRSRAPRRDRAQQSASSRTLTDIRRRYCDSFVSAETIDVTLVSPLSPHPFLHPAKIHD